MPTTTLTHLPISEAEYARLASNVVATQELVREALEARIDGAAKHLAETIVRSAIASNGREAKYELNAQVAELGWEDLGLFYQTLSDFFMSALQRHVIIAFAAFAHAVDAGKHVALRRERDSGYEYIVAQLASKPSQVWD